MEIEQVQQLVTRLLATSPAGSGLSLIGGYRYRLLDESARASRDIDYHWNGDLDTKQTEIIALFQRKLLPEVQRRFQYDGSASPATGPDPASFAVRVIELAFWRPSVPNSRIELPVDITKIACLDQPTAKTVNGTVYLTASDADLIEGKVLALLNRTFIEQRDLCDLFMFSSHLLDNSAERIARKLKIIAVPPEQVRLRLHAILDSRNYHIRAIDEVIEQQLDRPVADNLKAAGGGALIFDSVSRILLDQLRLVPGMAS